MAAAWTLKQICVHSAMEKKNVEADFYSMIFPVLWTINDGLRSERLSSGPVAVWFTFKLSENVVTWPLNPLSIRRPGKALFPSLKWFRQSINRDKERSRISPTVSMTELCSMFIVGHIFGGDSPTRVTALGKNWWIGNESIKFVAPSARHSIGETFQISAREKPALVATGRGFWGKRTQL